MTACARAFLRTPAWEALAVTDRLTEHRSPTRRAWTPGRFVENAAFTVLPPRRPGGSE
ncbi:hypothetical protein [Streptomyces sp. NPDC056361]|uniref:hypothetical protein n=1 Tax=Streptomyces sp. NPDC056361 TaxID=3345795 RepID=UPI0035DD4B83